MSSPGIRWIDRRDLPAIEAMFRAHGFEYTLPPIFPPEGFEARKGEPNPARNTVVRLVACDEENRPRMCALGRRIVEAFFLIDHAWSTPQKRYDRFLELHNAACESGRLLGYEEAWATLAAPIERSFARKIVPLGWERHEWATYKRAL